MPRSFGYLCIYFLYSYLTTILQLWPVYLWLIIFTILLFQQSSFASNTNYVRGSTAKSRRELIKGYHGVVATDDGRCSIIGRDILQKGGNAVDAAVAAALCLGVVSPASSGIGGGAFMLVRLANGTAQAFDMRETAPLLASENMYDGNYTLKAKGSLSIGVPGELAGLYEAWKQHGKLSWKSLVHPSEQLARNGFTVSLYLYSQMVKTESDIFADKGLRDIFTSNGKLLQPGDICVNTKLADTLMAVSKYGMRAFYNGPVGFDLIKDVREAGGILSMKDLQGYKVKMREIIYSDTFGLKVLGMPPPSSGGAAMTLILNILAQYGVPKGVLGPLGVHRTIEALKHAFAVRMRLGDPDFNDISEVLSDMVSPKFAAELKKTIMDNMTFDPSHYGGRYGPIYEHGTSHMSIVDSERNAVSMTSTVNSYFGAVMLSPRTGIVLNNEMDDFSMPNSSSALPPSPNSIVPGKRPMSSMTPTIVLKDDQLKAVIGASGGAMIIAGVTEVFLNYFAKRMDPLSSVMAPRFYHQLIPNKVVYENWTTVLNDHFELPLKTRRSLQKRGHVLESLSGGTICQFVVQNLDSSKKKGLNLFGELVAVSDPRKGGVPAGY